MEPFFIVGNRAELSRLRGASQLSPGWLADDLPVPDHRAGSDDVPTQPIRLIDPTEWTQDDWPRLLTMQDSVVAHLVVLESDSEIAEPIQRIQDLLNLLDQQMAGRDRTVRHVLLLIQSAAEVNGLTQPLLDQLLALSLPAESGEPSADPIWSAVYAMTGQLEPIGDSGFTSEKVWPLAVGQLLLHWLHELPPSIQSRDPRGRFFAWRHLMFSPDESESEGMGTSQPSTSDLDRLVTKSFQQIWRRVFLDRSRERPELGLTEGAMPVTPYKFKPSLTEKPYVSWTNYPAQQRLEERLSPERWKASTERIGRRLRQQASRYSAECFNRGRQASEGYWRMVHADPSVLIWPLTADGQERMSDESLEQLGDLVVGFEKDVVDHLRCSEEFMRAQAGWIEWPMRLLAIAAVVAATGYAALMSVYFLLGSWWMAAVCVLATIVGAVVAAFLSKDLESRAGRRGQFALQESLSRLDRDVQEKYVAAVDLFRSATQRNALVQRKTQIQHLESKRLQLHHEIQSLQSDMALGNQTRTADPGTLDLAGQYVYATTLPLPINMRPLDQDKAIAPFIDQEVDTFRERVWSPVCRFSDQRVSGEIDQDLLKRRIREHFERFTARLVSFAGKLAVAELERSRISDWYRNLTQHLQLDRYLSGASCQFPSGAAPPSSMRPEIQLVFQNGFETLGEDSRLDDYRSQRDAEGSPWLGDVPALGYMHERIPVQLVVRDGRLSVDFWQDDPRSASRLTDPVDEDQKGDSAS